MAVQLFVEESLHDWLYDERLKGAQRAVKALTNEYVLSTPIEEIAGRLTSELEIRPIVIDHGHIGIVDQGVKVRDGARVAVVRIVIPYTGHMRLLRMRPPIRPCAGMKADLVTEATIEVVVETPPTSSDVLTKTVYSIVSEIEGYLALSTKAVHKYNQILAETIASEVRAVQEQAQQAHEMISGLPFRLYRHADASRVVMPLQRSVVRPRRQPGSSSFTPNHVLEEADYEATLEVLHNMRTVIERNPSTFAKLALQEKSEKLEKVEERYRDLFLVILNTHFKGEVGSEVFNNSGKTDILIRVEDRNIFIGECKFWRGPVSLKEAVDQVLKYHSWRDSKAGLLLFVTRRDVKRAIKKAVAELVAHPQYIGPGKVQNDPEFEVTRFDVVMRSLRDPDHHIYLALLPFAIPRQPPTAASAAPSTRRRARSKSTQAPAP